MKGKPKITAKAPMVARLPLSTYTSSTSIDLISDIGTLISLNL